MELHGQYEYLQGGPAVLILIIMEDTHGGMLKIKVLFIKRSLNPYYNGRYSWSA